MLGEAVVLNPTPLHPLVARAIALLDRALPVVERADPVEAMVEQRLGRLTAGLGWAGVLAALMIVVYGVVVGDFAVSLVALAAVATLAVPLVGYKRGWSRHLVVQVLFGSTYLAQLSAACVTGGLRSWAAPALLLFPLGILS